MEIWIVCEDYTNAFFGIFLDEEKAKELAKEIGGYVIYGTIESNKIINSNGE